MSIINFNNQMKEYGELLRHLPVSSQRRCAVSTGARWKDLQVSKEEIQNLIYDALPQDYKMHIDCSFAADWQEMDDNEFLDVMMSYKRLDNAKRLKHNQKGKKERS